MDFADASKRFFCNLLKALTFASQYLSQIFLVVMENIHIFYFCAQKEVLL